MKTLSLIALSAALLISSAFAGNITVAWDPYVQSGTNVVVDKIMLYAVSGTNTVFTTGNSNSIYIASTSVTNTTYSFTGLSAGAWTITATAKSTTTGLESTNAASVWAIVPINGVPSLRVISSGP